MSSIFENINKLESIKSDIKSAIIQKGGSVTDAFGGYAQAIIDLPTGGGGTNYETQILDRTISGVYTNNSLTTVGEAAFFKCSNLSGVNLPNVTLLGTSAFTSCSQLTSVSLPNASIFGLSCFTFDTLLSFLYLPKANIFNSNALYSKIEYLGLGQSNVAILGSGLSNASKLSMQIPEHLVVDFSNGLPTSYMSLLSDANKMISSIYPTFRTSTYISHNYLYGINISMVNSNKSLRKVSLPQCWLVSNNAFSSCTSLTDVYLPNAQFVMDYAFNRCSGLRDIDLPKCEYLGTYAFAYASDLVVSIPLVTSIKDSTFYWVDYHMTLNIPKVEYFGHNALRLNPAVGYEVIFDVYLHKVTKVPTIEIDAFDNKSSAVKNFYVPESLVQDFKTAQYWSDLKYTTFIPYESTIDVEVGELFPTWFKVKKTDALDGIDIGLTVFEDKEEGTTNDINITGYWDEDNESFEGDYYHYEVSEENEYLVFKKFYGLWRQEIISINSPLNVSIYQVFA